jgi:hypothetical protein
MAAKVDKKSVKVAQDGKIVFQSSLPLVNPETLFTRSSWVKTFDFISNYLSAAMGVKKIKEDVYVSIRDLYFCKLYAPQIDIRNAEKHFSSFAETTLRIAEPNDRDNELHVGIAKDGLQASLYEFHNAICFSVGSAVASNGLSIKEQDFTQSPVEWKTNVDDLVRFADGVEMSLAGQGHPEMCRAFMTVAMQHVQVDISCFFEPIFSEHEAQIMREICGKNSVKLHRKVIPPRFTITFTP